MSTKPPYSVRRATRPTTLSSGETRWVLTVERGGPLHEHPQLEALRREQVAAGARPLHELTVAEARRSELESIRARDAGRVRPPADVRDLVLPGPAGAIPARLYRPKDAGELPVLVYFFGGGWVLGSLDAIDIVCRRFALVTPCAVLAVDYRQAPEHRFPAAVDDCYAATRWAREHAGELGLDGRRLAVGGASAGGNLAAAVTLRAREEGPRLRFQLLVYPVLDSSAEASNPEGINPVFFDRRAVEWCWAHYLASPADGHHPLASPLRSESLHGLPPALVITAALDPLCAEGELYASRLATAGVAVQLVRFDGMVHGFFSREDVLDAAADAQRLAADALRAAFEQAVSA